LCESMHITGENQEILIKVLLVHAMNWRDPKERFLSEKVHHLLIFQYGAIYPGRIHWGLYTVIEAVRSGFVFETHRETVGMIRAIIRRIERHGEASGVEPNITRCQKATYEQVCKILRVYGDHHSRLLQTEEGVEITTTYIVFALDLADQLGVGWLPREIANSTDQLAFRSDSSDVWLVSFLKHRQQIKSTDFFEWLDVFGEKGFGVLVRLMSEGLVTRSSMRPVLDQRRKDKALDEDRVRAALTAWRDLDYRRPLTHLLTEPAERLQHEVETYQRTTRDDTLF